MRSFRNGLAVVSLCAAMLIGAGKNAPIRHHAHATLDDDIITCYSCNFELGTYGSVKAKMASERENLRPATK